MHIFSSTCPHVCVRKQKYAMKHQRLEFMYAHTVTYICTTHMALLSCIYISVYAKVINMLVHCQFSMYVPLNFLL